MRSGRTPPGPSCEKKRPRRFFSQDPPNNVRRRGPPVQNTSDPALRPSNARREGLIGCPASLDRVLGTQLAHPRPLNIEFDNGVDTSSSVELRESEGFRHVLRCCVREIQSQFGQPTALRLQNASTPAAPNE
jgi:hypothetical protein